MLQLIKRLGEFDIDIIVSSHVLTDIEQTCNWVVMLDAGDLLVNGPLQEFDPLATVQAEIVGDPEQVVTALRGRGFEVALEGPVLVVGAGSDPIEQALVEEVYRAGAGLARMVAATTCGSSVTTAAIASTTEKDSDRPAPDAPSSRTGPSGSLASAAKHVTRSFRGL